MVRTELGYESPQQDRRQFTSFCPRHLSFWDKRHRTGSRRRSVIGGGFKGWAQLGEYDRALADYSAGVEHDTETNICYLNRGTLLLMLGEYERAITDFTQAIDDKPTAALALSRRGQAHEALDQESQALDDYRAALETYPKFQSAQEGFARITKQQRRSEEQP